MNIIFHKALLLVFLKKIVHNVPETAYSYYFWPMDVEMKATVPDPGNGPGNALTDRRRDDGNGAGSSQKSRQRSEQWASRRRQRCRIQVTAQATLCSMGVETAATVPDPGDGPGNGTGYRRVPAGQMSHCRTMVDWIICGREWPS